MQSTQTSEHTIPVKRTTGETLQDRLRDTVLNELLPRRYLNKDENGNVTETPEELFERIAKNIALAEVVYEAQQLGDDAYVTPEIGRAHV